MTKKELKKIYERYSWAFKRQVLHDYDGWITLLDSDRWPQDESCPENKFCRLKPAISSDLPEPTEDMYNKAVYLGTGQIELPAKQRFFLGWQTTNLTKDEWKAGDLFGKFRGTSITRHYCVSLDDPNADEIIALNVAVEKNEIPHVELNVRETLSPNDILYNLVQKKTEEAERLTLSGNPQDWLEAKTLEIVTHGINIARHTLMNEYYNTETETEWIGLDEFEFSIMNEGSSEKFDTLTHDEAYEMAALRLIKYGPTSVKIRRRK